MRLAPEHHPLPRLLVFPFGLIALAAVAAVILDPALVQRLAHCPLRDATGLPCPTCGGTRAAIALVHGRWGAALAANPFAAMGLVLFGFWLAWGLAATAWPPLRRDIVLGDRERKTARIAAGAALLAAWMWQILAGR